MRKASVLAFLVLATLSMAVAEPAVAHDEVAAQLRSFEEVPAIVTGAAGDFEGVFNDAGTEMSYNLSYFNVRGTVTQAHLHIGQRGVNGAIVIFLCSNLGNGPAGTQACPADPGEISGTITAANVGGGAANQGIGPGGLGAVVRAMRAGVVYVNVHTDIFPGGELRGQLQLTRHED